MTVGSSVCVYVSSRWLYRPLTMPINSWIISRVVRLMVTMVVGRCMACTSFTIKETGMWMGVAARLGRKHEILRRKERDWYNSVFVLFHITELLFANRNLPK